MRPRATATTEPTTTRADLDGGAVRTCIGCRRRRSAADLTRFVLDADGAVLAGRILPGRGAWLCADRLHECLDEASPSRWSRAFRRRVSTEAVDALRIKLDPQRSSSPSR